MEYQEESIVNAIILSLLSMSGLCFAQAEKLPRLPPLGVSLEVMQQSNFNLIENKKKIDIDKVENLGRILDPIRVRSNFELNRREQNRDGIIRTTSEDSFGTRVGVSVDSGYLAGVLARSTNLKSQKFRLEDTATDLAADLVAAHLAYELSRRAIKVLKDSRSIPLLVQELSYKIADEARAESIRNIASSYLLEIGELINRTTFNLQDAHTSFATIVPPASESFQEHDQLVSDSLENYFNQLEAPVGFIAPEPAKVLEKKIRRAIRRVESAAPPPESAEQGLALALISAPGLEVRRLRIVEMKQKKAEQLLDLIGPTIEVGGRFSNTHDNFERVDSSSSAFIFTLTWTYRGGDIPRLIAADKQVKLAEVEFESSQHRLLIAMQRLLSRLTRNRTQLDLSIQSHRNAYQAVNRIQGQIDEENPDPELVLDLIDLHQVSVRERLNLEDVYGSTYLSHFQIYALIESLSELIARVKEMGSDYF